jgi:hypothetical protein
MFARTNALRWVAKIISQEPMFLFNAKAATENIFSKSPNQYRDKQHARVLAILGGTSSALVRDTSVEGILLTTKTRGNPWQNSCYNFTQCKA